MSEKSQFLITAIEEVQHNVRTIDTRAAVIIAFESTLLVIAVIGIISGSFFQVIRNLVENGVIWYAALILATFVLYVMSLIVHVLMTIRVVLPIDDAADHVITDNFEHKGMYFLEELDRARSILPPATKYAEQLNEMGEEELNNEYIYELLRLSYIRRVKSDRLSFSFLLLGGLILGITAFGFLLAAAGILF
jgi:hypothetical protein